MRYIPTDSRPVKRSLAGVPENFPTADEVRELLNYDQKTGVFTWAVNRRGTAKAGTVAGSLAGQGHIQITFKGTRYYAHRLAWLVTYGEWPPADMDVDHIDCDKGNNAIANLRLASRSQNAANASGLRKNNTSGYRGVSFYRRTGRWEARILVEGVTHRLGYHKTAEEAARAYDRACYRLNGPFAYLNFPEERSLYRRMLSAFTETAKAFGIPIQLKFELAGAEGVA